MRASRAPSSVPSPRAAPARRPPSSRAPVLRRTRLGALRVRRLHRALVRRLTLLSGWTWVAAGSLVGFEMLDILVGGFLLAPELLPIVLVILAGVWYFRRGLRRATRRVHAAIRGLRAKRRRVRARDRGGAGSERVGRVMPPRSEKGGDAR